MGTSSILSHFSITAALTVCIEEDSTEQSILSFSAQREQVSAATIEYPSLAFLARLQCHMQCA